MDSSQKNKLFNDIVHFLTNIEKYKKHVALSGDKHILLVNKKHFAYQVVVLFYADPQATAAELSAEWRKKEKALCQSLKQKNIAVRFLFFVLSEQEKKDRNQDDSLYNLNATNWEKVLLELYPNFSHYQEDRFTDITNMPMHEVAESSQEKTSSISRDLRKIRDKMYLKNLIYTPLALVFIVILPLLLFIFKGAINGVFSSVNMTEWGLLAGGGWRDFMVGAGQWWRLFTWFFSGNLFEQIIFGICLLVLIRYSELLMKKWQVGLLFLLGLPLLAFLLTITEPQVVLAGAIPLVSLFYGAMMTHNLGKSDLLTSLSRNRTIIIPIILVIWPLILQDWNEYVWIIAGLLLGYGFGLVFVMNFKLQKWDNHLIMAIIILLGFLIFPIVLLLVVKNTPPMLPYPNDLAGATLYDYLKSSFMSSSSVRDLLINYYHLDPNNLGAYTNNFL